MGARRKRAERSVLRAAALLALSLLALSLISGCADRERGSQVPPRERTLPEARLLAALREGGYVIFFRHAATDFSTPDAEEPDLRDCSTQRNLTPEGRRQAREIGEAFRRLNIPTGPVLASPYCRARQTALLAFGRAKAARAFLPPDHNPPGPRRRPKLPNGGLSRLLSTPPPPGKNAVLVGHESALREATGTSLPEGGAAVFDPRAAESPPSPLKVLPPGYWSWLASREKGRRRR
jgi:phosphohistidine phosphatase SixA